MRDILWQVVVSASGEFGITADRRERRSQFMAGIRDELAHAALALLPGFQGIVDVAEQGIERGADFADLRALIGVGLGHSSGEIDLATVETHRRNLRCGGGYPAQGPEGVRHDEPGRQGDKEDAAERYAPEHPRETLELALSVGERQAVVNISDGRILRQRDCHPHKLKGAEVLKRDRRGLLRGDRRMDRRSRGWGKSLNGATDVRAHFARNGRADQDGRNRARLRIRLVERTTNIGNLGAATAAEHMDEPVELAGDA
ncbi:MAG: hypothetical protein JWQ77_4226 [Jatrophihabitans sp.]|nr:hypothetical protein [Jatrophihabitans sp.]